MDQGWLKQGITSVTGTGYVPVSIDEIHQLKVTSRTTIHTY